MSIHRFTLALAGALATAVIGAAATMAHGPRFVATLQASAEAARDAAGGTGIAIRFTTPEGWLTRHPRLSGGDDLPPEVRTRVAAQIAAIPGIGGAHWQTRRLGTAASQPAAKGPRHCEQDVAAILKARSIRFAEASAAIDPASNSLLDEVAAALRPCVGSIIAITGHTDGQGDSAENQRLSRERADAVRAALVLRGIPADGLRSVGQGADKPLAGLDPQDAANRRIEFTVISTQPLRPTPIDTPGPG